MPSCVSVKKNGRRISQASSLKMKTSSRTCHEVVVDVEVVVEVEVVVVVEVEVVVVVVVVVDVVVEVVDLATIALDHLFEMV